MTLNEKSRALESALFGAINASGLPLCVCELHAKVLLNAIQNTLRQEEEKETAAEAAKRAETQPAETSAPAQSAVTSAPAQPSDGDTYA